MRKQFIALLAFVVATVPAAAHNNYFLPGDAFFSVAVSQSDMSGWSKSSADTLELSYSRFDDEFFACGNIGYTSLTVTGVSAEFRSGLAEAYRRFTSGHVPLYREEGDGRQSVLEQTNSVVALVYSKHFNLDLPLGLKFNEDWMTQGSGRYCGLFTTSQPVILDWSKAGSVDPLPVVEKLEPTAHLASSYEVANTMDDVLHIKADDIMMVLVGFANQKSYAVVQGCPELQSIFDSEDGARYMAVTKTQIRDFNCDKNGKWTETVLEPVAAEKVKLLDGSKSTIAPRPAQASGVKPAAGSPLTWAATVHEAPVVKEATGWNGRSLVVLLLIMLTVPVWLIMRRKGKWGSSA